jgi:hypothetical protein
MCRWPLPFRWKGKALQKKRGTDRMIKFENSFITSDSSRELSRPVKGVPFRRVNHAELEFPPWAKFCWPQRAARLLLGPKRVF